MASVSGPGISMIAFSPDFRHNLSFALNGIATLTFAHIAVTVSNEGQDLWRL